MASDPFPRATGEGNSQASFSQLPDAAEVGHSYALAVETRRIAKPWLDSHNGLFDGIDLDAVATAYAVSHPWCTARELLLPWKFGLLIFVVDQLVDTDAATLDEASAIAKRLVAVADGFPPSTDEPITTVLAEIRDQLRASALWDELGTQWRDAIKDTVDSMVEEWSAAHGLANGGRSMTVDDYLLGSDSFGLAAASLTWEIAMEDVKALEHQDQLMAATRQAQIAARLTNDLCTFQRECVTNDLNVLKLEVNEDEVRDRIRRAVEQCEQLIRPLLVDGVRSAGALTRVVAFGSAFYNSGLDFRLTV